MIVKRIHLSKFFVNAIFIGLSSNAMADSVEPKIGFGSPTGLVGVQYNKNIKERIDVSAGLGRSLENGYNATMSAAGFLENSNLFYSAGLSYSSGISASPRSGSESRSIIPDAIWGNLGIGYRNVITTEMGVTSVLGDGFARSFKKNGDSYYSIKGFVIPYFSIGYAISLGDK